MPDTDGDGDGRVRAVRKGDGMSDRLLTPTRTWPPGGK